MAEAQTANIPFTRRNLKVFVVGLLVIGLGYVLLSIPPADGFLSLTLAPILLVLGYCVIIPVSLLLKDEQRLPERDGGPGPAQDADRTDPTNS